MINNIRWDKHTIIITTKQVYETGWLHSRMSEVSDGIPTDHENLEMENNILKLLIQRVNSVVYCCFFVTLYN